MTADGKRAHAEASRILRSHGFLTLATQGTRIWSEIAAFRLEGEDLLCTLREGSQSMENVRLNPRVSFSIGVPPEGRSVCGSGIARPVTGARGVVAVSPYRFELDGSARGAHKSGGVIVRKGPDWRIDDAAHVHPREGIRQWIGFWLKATRAVSFPLSILPVVVGTVLALTRGAFDPLIFVLSLLGGVFSHAAANLVSDYNDFRKGIDTPDALSTHPGVLVEEALRPEAILGAAFLLSLLTVAVGAFLVAKVGFLVIVFGAVGLLGGVSYTSGSLAYKYRGLGEIFIFFLMGPLMVAGAYFVQLRRLDAVPVILSIPLGLLVASVTLANNMRDIVDDRRSGTLTLPMSIGILPAKLVYCGMLVLAYAIVAIIVALDLSRLPLLLTLLSLPAAVKAISAVWRAGDTPEQIRAGAREGRYPLNSIRLHLRFAALLIAGCLASWLLNWHT